ncbi:class I SAM-dependent methyltransferase [Rubrivivax rivuli]|uniref:class I SAM-dependent methyltransferase n=1 Tax=Rubrivivax rivuli TaxID=1862385 RepID=UPI001FDFE195|nr:class I SAM-dependent methyltransferase [Rubrivivax rivuli]
MNPASTPPIAATAAPARLAPRGWARRLPWPLPAVAVWGGAWALWLGLAAVGLPPALAFAVALAASTAAALSCGGRWRQAIAAAGLPLSAWVLGAAGTLPSWVWLLLLLPVLAVYPLRAWSDAPLFPTPADALQGLERVVGTPRKVHDAGCGLGHGLVALRCLWPQAALSGVEWSPLLAWATRWRCRGVQVRRGDMWAVPWCDFDLVYLFQRPESMARAHAKAMAEMAPGAWLVSLEFAVPGVVPVACLQGEGRKPVWVYQPVPAPVAVPAPSRPPSIPASGGR